jgi:glycosyltransferase involved in cell wall biosynthesis
MLISSKDEGMSLGFLEALACGLYIITTPVSGTDRHLIHGINGDIILFSDCNKLAGKIEEFYYQKFQNSYKIPDKILKQVRQDIGWEKIVEAYHNLISV